MAPRSTEQNEQIRADTRQRLLRAALVAFGKQGYASTSTKRIAEQAGVSAGLLFHYFPTKAALLQALFEESMGQVMASFAEAAEAPDARSRLEKLVRVSFRIVGEHLDFWRLSYGVRMQAEVLGDLGTQLPGWTAQVTGLLEFHLAEVGIPNAGVEAKLLFALIDGCSQHYVLDPVNYPIQAVADAIVARFLPPAPESR